MDLSMLCYLHKIWLPVHGIRKLIVYNIFIEIVRFGCSGGIPGLVFDYIQKDGLVTDACFPYLSSNGDTHFKCPEYCYNNSSKLFKSDKHFAQSVYHVGHFVENKHERVLQIQKEIATNG